MECFLAGMMITSGIVVLGSYTEMLDYAMYIVAKYLGVNSFYALGILPRCPSWTTCVGGRCQRLGSDSDRHGPLKHVGPG